MARVNDRGMPPLVDLSLVPDASGIDRVAQDVMDMSAIKGLASRHAPWPANPPTRPEPKIFRAFFHDSDEPCSR